MLFLKTGNKEKHVLNIIINFLYKNNVFNESKYIVIIIKVLNYHFYLKYFLSSKEKNIAVPDTTTPHVQ